MAKWIKLTAETAEAAKTTPIPDPGRSNTWVNLDQAELIGAEDIVVALMLPTGAHIFTRQPDEIAIIKRYLEENRAK
jgi:hypothetical protein